MTDVKLEPRRNRFNLCLQSMRRVCEERVGTVAVAGDLAVGDISPVSASLPWSAPKVDDDRWGRVVSGSVFQNGIFLFSVMNE